MRQAGSQVVDGNGADKWDFYERMADTKAQATSEEGIKESKVWMKKFKKWDTTKRRDWNNEEHRDQFWEAHPGLTEVEAVLRHKEGMYAQIRTVSVCQYWFGVGD